MLHLIGRFPPVNTFVEVIERCGKRISLNGPEADINAKTNRPALRRLVRAIRRRLRHRPPSQGQECTERGD